MEGDNLSVGLLDLLQLSEVVPESGLGDNVVGRKDSHSVELGSLLLLRGELSSDDGVLGESGHSASQRQVTPHIPHSKHGSGIQRARGT